ncbi:MAG: PaaI family thioesterase [Sphingorhabdus sp.]
MVSLKPDLGTAIPEGASFDPALINKMMGQFGHGGFLRTDYVGHGDDWVELAIDWREDLVADPETGILASAVVISLMDNATSLSIWTKLGEFRPQVTMDLRIDYLRPSPAGKRVYGRGICYHLTNSIGFVRGYAHNGDVDDLLAHASGTFIRVGDRIA